MPKLRNPLLFFSITTLLIASCQKDVIPDVNLVPKVDAGASQVTKVDNLTLTGSASDSDGKVVAFLWSQVSGPSKATIVNEGSATTKVINLKNGTYLFQLMATDNEGATGVDTVSVQAILPTSQTLTLQPANNTNEYQLVYYLASNFWSGGEEFALETWTKNGDPMNTRHVAKFDLSAIPSNATIQSAQLYLYSNPGQISGNLTDPNYGSANGFYVRQITNNWTQSSISWNNEPVTTTANQVYVPHTSQRTLDLAIDVKGAVTSMVANNANYGWYFKLENEVTYTSRIFVGSFNTKYPEKRPKLVITYQ